jgi:hypothetical protein
MPNLTSKKTKTLNSNSLIKNQITNILQPVNGTVAITPPTNTILTQNAVSSKYYIPLLEKITGEQTINVRAPLAFNIVSQQTAYDIGKNWVNAVSGVLGTGLDNQWTSVCWSPELGLFCAVAQSGNTNERIMISSDGLNWRNAINVPSISNWFSVCWSPKLGLFCAVGYSTGTTIQRVIVSTNGLNWSNAIDGVLTNDWLSVCWSPELELFCAVAYSGTTNQRVMISRNGYNWTSATSGVLELVWREICWSPELALFCAVASNGTTNERVMVSSDGLRWRNATTGVLGNEWYGVCWSPELGLFCAVANTGTTNQRIMVSSDGLNWRNATSGVLDLVWNSVCWAPQLGLFCAVATSGTTNQRVMVSSDGLNWRNATSGVLNGQWYRVCWSPELSSFCAVDIVAGTTNQRVMITNPIYRLPTSTMNTLSVPNVKLNKLPICNVDAINSYDLVNKKYVNKYVGFDLSGGDRWFCEDWITGSTKGQFNWNLFAKQRATNTDMTLSDYITINNPNPNANFTNHIGVLRLFSFDPNSTGNISTTVSSNVVYNTSKLKSLRFICTLSAPNNLINLFLGLSSSTPVEGSNRIGFKYSSVNDNTNIIILSDVTENGTTKTNTFTSNLTRYNWVLFEIHKNSKNITLLVKNLTNNTAYSNYSTTISNDFDAYIYMNIESNSGIPSNHPEYTPRFLFIDYIDWVVSS